MRDFTGVATDDGKLINTKKESSYNRKGNVPEEVILAKKLHIGETPRDISQQ